MERESNSMQALCRSGCGFYGNPSTDGLCSLCYKEALKKKQQPPNAGPTGGSAFTSSAATNAAAAAAFAASSTAANTAFSSTPSIMDTAVPTIPVISPTSEQNKDVSIFLKCSKLTLLNRVTSTGKLLFFLLIFTSF